MFILKCYGSAWESTAPLLSKLPATRSPIVPCDITCTDVKVRVTSGTNTGNRDKKMCFLIQVTQRATALDGLEVPEDVS